MQASCVHCGTEHKLKDADLSAHAKVQFRCTKCGKTTVVELKARPDSTMVITPLPSFARSASSTASLRLPPEDEGLRLPTETNVVLAVISGPDQGAVHRLTKARVVIGRKGSDVAIDDAEVSRNHCVLEVRENYINLKDLDSTNGTFFEEERVRAAMLQDGGEFRVGTSVIRVSFQKK